MFARAFYISEKMELILEEFRRLFHPLSLMVLQYSEDFYTIGYDNDPFVICGKRHDSSNYQFLSPRRTKEQVIEWFANATEIQDTYGNWVKNPYFGCKSLEEMEIAYDYLIGDANEQ